MRSKTGDRTDPCLCPEVAPRLGKAELSTQGSLLGRVYHVPEQLGSNWWNEQAGGQSRGGSDGLGAGMPTLNIQVARAVASRWREQSW